MAIPAFRSQADAVKAAREFFWGTVHHSQRPTFNLAQLKASPIFDTPRGYFATYVTADVNGRDVLIEFDTFGRTTAVTKIKGA